MITVCIEATQYMNKSNYETRDMVFEDYLLLTWATIFVACLSFCTG